MKRTDVKCKLKKVYLGSVRVINRTSRGAWTHISGETHSALATQLNKVIEG